MKSKLLLVLLALTIQLSGSVYAQSSEKLNATFKGVQESGQFMFVDNEETVHEFDEVYYELDIDLYDDSYVGKSFVIEWEEESYETYDDEGNPTGAYVPYKVIVQLELVQ